MKAHIEKANLSIKQQHAIIDYFQYRIDTADQIREKLLIALTKAQKNLTDFEAELIAAPEKIAFAQDRIKELNFEKRSIVVIEPKTAQYVKIMKQIADLRAQLPEGL